MAQSVDAVQIEVEMDSDDLLFEMDSDDEEEEDRSFLSTPPSSGYALDAASKLKGIPELHINIVPSTDTMRSQESRSLSTVEVIHEDSETDDRHRNYGNDTPSRTRRNANTSKSGHSTLLSPQKSSQFGVKSSGSLRIKKMSESKSMLSRTLNVHSALVNLNKRHFDDQQGTRYHEATHSLSESIEPKPSAVAKTFNPPKQWLETLKLDENKRKTKGRAQSNATKPSSNGTLTVGTHTFSGIWAKTTDSKKAGDPDGDGAEEQNRRGVQLEDGDDDSAPTPTVHDLFETKQSLQTNGLYAYSVAPKWKIPNLLEIDQEEPQ